MGRLDGKVALISGGARGQGAAEARMFASEGACVVFGDILDDDGRMVEAEIRELGSQATYVHLDVTSEADWAAAVNRAVSEYGKLDVLVNNAGIVLGRTIEEMTVEEWDRLFDVNAKGVFLGTRASLGAMRDAGGGSIVNISSTAGLVGNDYNLAGYSSTKGAVRLFTKSTAIQHARDGIRCNSVHPGPIDTPMLVESRRGRGALTDEQQRQRTPLGRIGRPEDIAFAVIYLASDESSFVTGSEVVVDGGRTAM
jgi:cyclopentanol dehydrogenase